VFQDVIAVFFCEPPQDCAGYEIVAEIVEVEADLEVDKMRMAVFALQDVLWFVGVDVGDVSLMECVEEGEKLIEERIGDCVFFG